MKSTLVRSLGKFALAMAATMAFVACTSPLSPSVSSTGSTSPTAAATRSIVTTPIKDSNAKIETLIANDLTNLSDILPAGTSQLTMKVPGIPNLNQQYGPVTFTKYYYQDGTSGYVLNSNVVGVDFVSEMPIIAVYVKGGNVGKDAAGKNVSGGNFYTWTEGSSMSGTELTTAVNPANNMKTAISHIEFAWIPKVLVTATAGTSYDRQYDWSIAKTNDASSVTPNSQLTPFMLDAGQTAPVVYTVTVGAVPVDYNFLVSGTITVTNPAYNLTDAVLTSVTAGSASIGGTVGTVSVGNTASFAYSFAPADKSSGTVTATVATSSNVSGGTASVGYTFGEPVNVTDKSIAVTDSLVPSANRTINLGDAYSFTYSLAVSASSMTPTVITNVAACTESDSKRAGSASSDVWVQLKPSLGYTRSMGYWKTHGKSSYQNHPVLDTTWNKLSGGINTPFFISGQSYIDVMWFNDGGNAYYQLARQYAGAKLNTLTGYAADAATAAAMAKAEALFAKYTPAAMGALKSVATDRKDAISAAGVLGAFNIDRNNIQ